VSNTRSSIGITRNFLRRGRRLPLAGMEAELSPIGPDRMPQGAELHLSLLLAMGANRVRINLLRLLPWEHLPLSPLPRARLLPPRHAR
jgi:hypothetical protein